MEQKLDEFFRRKIHKAENNIPDDSTFDEQVFWSKMQNQLAKPKPATRWKWVAIAACLAGITWWGLYISKTFTDSVSPKKNYTQTIEKPIIQKPLTNLSINPLSAKPHKKDLNKPKKSTPEQPQKLKVEIESIAIKSNTVEIQPVIIKQDSIYFKSNSIVEAKPTSPFKTVHINEISKQEESPIKQPKFKIKFAAVNTKH